MQVVDGVRQIITLYISVCIILIFVRLAVNRYLDEQLASAKQRSDTSRSVYVFSEMNPYVGHPDPLKEGQELFRKGLLSEAVLALEAEVLKNPDNTEGWRLLGITHAENDDDQQVSTPPSPPPLTMEVWERCLFMFSCYHSNSLKLYWSSAFITVIITHSVSSKYASHYLNHFLSG